MSSTKDSAKVVSNLYGVSNKNSIKEIRFSFFLSRHCLIDVMGKLNFTVGENLPVLLGNLAQEKLIYEQDPVAAIEVFTKSLGMPEDIALECLSGINRVLCFDSQTEDVYLDLRKNLPDSSYPILDTEKLRSRWLSELREDIDSYRGVFLNDINLGVSINIDIDLRDLIDIFLGRGYDIKDRVYSKIMNLFEDREEEYVDTTVRVGYLVGTFLEWSIGLFKKYDTLKFLEERALLPLNTESTEDLNYILRNSVRVYNDIKRLLEELDYVEEIKKHCIDTLRLYQTNPITSKLLQCNILPVSIEDNYSAGWLSPDGDFFGMNGEYADMLHTKISDLLYLDGIIPEERNYAKDTYLELNGWVKIHGKFIQFSCEDVTTEGKFKVTRYLTEKQVKAIYRYGQICYNGLLHFGYQQKPISVALFSMMDDIARSNLFRIS